LWAFGLGLFGFVLVKVLVPAYFSRQDTKTPVKFGIAAMLVNITLNLGVLALYKINIWTLAPHAGLALATALGAFVNAGLLYIVLRKKGYYQLQNGWFGFLLKVLVACIVMGGLVFIMRGELSDWTAIGLWSRVIKLTTVILSAAVIYFAILYVLGLRPKQFLKQ